MSTSCFLYVPHLVAGRHITHAAHALPPAAHIPLFLYPFLQTMSKTRPFEYLRLTSLGVIGALVKVGGGGNPHAPGGQSTLSLRQGLPTDIPAMGRCWG